ncbi:high mobility group protein B3 [Vigna unguiculata]|uniref:High mobility group protein B3 n=1 Tax=Vigna unguiculata TaxID=3917 RepID=A0A4D6KYL1_VIGUN|nr:high mobility group protein B3 [Vigna unguiculata]
MPKVKADTKAADNRLKRKGAGAGRKQSKKAAKDPNKPKRPPSAFFVFMSEFREQFKKEHPNNKSVAVEKAPFIARAEKKKEEYEKSISAYNKKLEGKHSEEEESDKSKSEVNDEEEDEEDDEDDE